MLACVATSPPVKPPASFRVGERVVTGDRVHGLCSAGYACGTIDAIGSCNLFALERPSAAVGQRRARSGERFAHRAAGFWRCPPSRGMAVRLRPAHVSLDGPVALEASDPMFARPFYYLRHGETETNASRLVAGSLDVDLTALGRKQARTAAKMLASAPITGIYSSPLKRASHTAEPIGKALKLPVIIIPEIAERNWGALEGKPRGSRVRGVTPEGAETMAEFTRRVLSGFSRIDSACRSS